MKLSGRLMLSFMTVLGISLALSALLASYTISLQFDRFMEGEHAARVQNLLTALAEEIQIDGEKLVFEQEVLDRLAAMEGYALEIRDGNGEIAYRAEGLRGHMGHMTGMMGQSPILGTYREETHPLRVRGEPAGTLVVGYYGAFNRSAAATGFRSAIVRLAVFSVLIALVTGGVVSRKLSGQIAGPVSEIEKGAESLARGVYGQTDFPDSSIREINRLVKAMERLDGTLGDQDALRRRMAADMAHEIRTPVANLKAQIQAARDGLLPHDKELLKSLFEETERLGFLVAGIEDINRLKGGIPDLNLEEVFPGREVLKVLKTLEPIFEKAHLEPRLEDDFQGAATLDRQRFKQVLHALYANAAKYADPDTFVTTRLYASEGWLVVEVEDEGAGVDPGEIDKIFEYLYRSDDSRSRETGGFGIGLSVAKAIVEAHGGAIRAESAKGRWTRIRMTFPLAEGGRGLDVTDQ